MPTEEEIRAEIDRLMQQINALSGQAGSRSSLAFYFLLVGLLAAIVGLVLAVLAIPTGGATAVPALIALLIALVTGLIAVLLQRNELTLLTAAQALLPQLKAKQQELEQLQEEEGG